MSSRSFAFVCVGGAVASCCDHRPARAARSQRRLERLSRGGGDGGTSALSRRARLFRQQLSAAVVLCRGRIRPARRRQHHRRAYHFAYAFLCAAARHFPGCANDGLPRCAMPRSRAFSSWRGLSSVPTMSAWTIRNCWGTQSRLQRCCSILREVAERYRGGRPVRGRDVREAQSRGDAARRRCVAAAGRPRPRAALHRCRLCVFASRACALSAGLWR